jgi:toxin CcdB
MARFHIYQNTSTRSAVAPFLVDVQNDFIESLATRIVIPLMAANAIKRKPTGDVFPLIQVLGTAYFLFTHELAAAPLTRLRTIVGTVNVEDRIKIQNALDRVFVAY